MPCNCRDKMPAPTATVAAGITAAALAAGVSVATYVANSLTMHASRKEREAARSEEEQRKETAKRNQEELERREARRRRDGMVGAHSPPHRRAVELMQLHVASALDQLSASLRSAGVGSLSPVPLPGAEEPDLVAAYAALLLGRDVWGVMGPARMQALLTFGGTLAALSPTASRIVEEWLQRLGSPEGAILPDLRLDCDKIGPKMWLVGPVGEVARQLSDKGMQALQSLLLEVLTQFERNGTDGVDGGAHPVAWFALLCVPQDDVSAIIRLIRIHLPWLAVHPRISCSLRHSGASWTVSVLEPRYSFDLSFDSFDLSFNPFHLSFDFFDLSFDICQRIFAMGRTSTRLGANSGRDYQPGPTPGTAVLLVTSCVPSSVKKFTMTWEYAQYNRPIKEPYRAGTAPAVPFRDVERDISRLLSHAYLQRAVGAVQVRLQHLRRRMAAGAGPAVWPTGTGPEPLAGCGAEHCAALSGSGPLIDEVLSQHAMWGKVAEQLQQDGRQQRVVAGLKARLMQHLPPPPPSPQPAPQQTSPPSQAADAGEAARLVQLEREVDDFLSCLMPLTAARYMAVPRAGPAALAPQDVLAAEAVDAEAWRGFTGFVPERAGARLALRYAHEKRDRARREAVVTPWWLPPALYVAAVAVVAVVVLGLVHAAGGWLGRVSPQAVADACEGVERAVGRVLITVGAGSEGSLMAAAAWRLLGTWRLWCAVLQAWLAVRWTVKLLPRDVAAGVVWVRDYLGLGLFLGRHRLLDLQRRVDATLCRWAVRLAEARMREAVARGSVSWADVQAIMGAMEAAAGAGAGPAAKAGARTKAGAVGARAPMTPAGGLRVAAAGTRATGKAAGVKPMAAARIGPKTTAAAPGAAATAAVAARAAAGGRVATEARVGAGPGAAASGPVSGTTAAPPVGTADPPGARAGPRKRARGSGAEPQVPSGSAAATAVGAGAAVPSEADRKTGSASSKATRRGRQEYGVGTDGGGGVIRNGFVEVVLPGSQEEVEAFLRLPVVEEEGHGDDGVHRREGRAGEGSPLRASGEVLGGGLQVLELLCEGVGFGLGPGAGDAPLALPGPSRKGNLSHGGAFSVAGTATGAVAAGRSRVNARVKHGGSGAAAPAAPVGAGTDNAPAGDRAARRAGGRGHKAVSQRLEEDGWQVVRRGRHVVYRREVGGGRTQTFVRSATPSDWRTARNQLAELRRRNWEAEEEMVLAAAAMEVASSIPPEVLMAQAELACTGQGWTGTGPVAERRKRR